MKKIPLTAFVAFVGLSLLAQKEGRQPYDIQKSAFGEKAMVVTAHPIASKVGLEVLKSGGNAVDAAIAVHFALAVVYPQAGNIGGGGFLLYRKADGEVAALDYRETAPALAGKDMFLDENGNPVSGLSTLGCLSAGVPGSVDGMYEAFKKYSKLKNWRRLVQPAVRLAAKGFPITKQEADNLNDLKKDFEKYNTVVPVFVREKPWKPGDVMVQSDLAATLRLIRDRGRSGFYEGPVAAKIVQQMKASRGIISAEDLKNYRSVWRKPLGGKYRGYDVVGMPPPSSGGVALLQLLGIMEHTNLSAFGFHSPQAVHQMIEAERRVYADRATHLGDPDYFKVPIERLLDSIYLFRRFQSIDTSKATKSTDISAADFSGHESDQTTHFSIVDENGDAVSCTTTLNNSYGSKTVVAGAGFLLNDEMDDFSVKPGVPNMYGLVGAEANAIAPGKRMLSSMTPTIVSKDGKLYMVLGSPGGSTIITTVFQNIVNVIDFGMSAQDANFAPRFHQQWLPEHSSIERDGRLPEETLKILESKGHVFKERGYIGRLEMILATPDGRLEGAADKRGDDHAEGY